MINNDLKMSALECAEEVLDAVKAAGPHGLRFIDGAAALDMEYSAFYSMIHELARQGHVKVGRGCDGHANRVLMPDAVEPDDIWLSPKQRAVLAYLHQEADEFGLAQASHKQISRATGVTCPSFCLDRLDIKGYLDRVALGGPSNPATYKIYPDGTGQKSDTWWLLKYGREKFIEIAEQWAAAKPEDRATFLDDFDAIEKTLRAGR